MKILAIGANGVIGQAVTNLLAQEHEVVAVGYSKGGFTVDIGDKESIRSLFEQIGEVDAIICMAGNGEMGELDNLTDQHFSEVLNNKLMGQINVARIGIEYLTKAGSITLTSGQAANNPFPGTTAIAVGVSGVNAFIQAAATELKEGKRINAVSPGIVKETLDAWGKDSSYGVPAKQVATYYRNSVLGQENGHVFDAILSA
ncbi:short chain dehydrogenase [Vibrio atypicus]|uniref:short chain dehydrogenase n=1 Tax=Vibrio atypicus TaxID=558271 RepID=UPI003734DDB0